MLYICNVYNANDQATMNHSVLAQERACDGCSCSGIELEAKYGYLPWLHPNDNHVDPLDVRWFVDHGTLPKHPVGSKVQPPK